jgi:hypothetical protein
VPWKGSGVLALWQLQYMHGNMGGEGGVLWEVAFYRGGLRWQIHTSTMRIGFSSPIP